MTFGPLRLGLVARAPKHVTRGELFQSLFDLLGGKRGWKLNLWPAANDLINRAYIKKSP